MTIQIDTTQSKAGGTSLLIPGGTNATATQTITGLKANHVYLAQCWVKTDGNVLGTGSYGAGMWGTCSTGTLAIVTTTGSSHGFGSTYFDVELAATIATDWTLLQCVFQPSADCTLTLRLNNGVGGGSVGTGNTWLDLVSVTDVTGQIGPAVAASTAVQQQNSVDYLTPSDKASLMQQYKSEQQTKAQLDAQATAAGVSSAAYDGAFGGISTTLTNAGAPANWATAWPDGTTLHYTGIVTTLATAWASVALYRTTLQNGINSAQAAVQATNALNTAIKAAQPHIVAWSYTSKPSLPDSNYPAGYYAITTDYRTVQVSTDETTWNDIFIAAAGLFGTITAGQLSANAIQTSNYAENTNGNPIAGAKLALAGVALKVASGGLQIGSYLFNDWMLPRIAQALDGNASQGMVFYRGNCDYTYRGGAPNINCLDIVHHSFNRIASVNEVGYWTYTLTPTSYSNTTDNLDALRALRIQFFQAATSNSAFQDIWFPVTDRLYQSSTSNGVVKGSFSWSWREGYDGAPSANLTGSNNSYGGYLRAQLINAYGYSATMDFAPSSTYGMNLTKGTNLITGSASSGGSGGGSGGGACPAPWLPITLASGLTVPAGSLYDGAEVVGIDENTKQPAVGIVRNPRRIWAKRVPIALEDGRILEYSLHHRKLVDRGWVAVEELEPGETLLGSNPGIVKSVGIPHLAEVIDFIVDGCHTYETDGTLDHNAKVAMSEL